MSYDQVANHTLQPISLRSYLVFDTLCHSTPRHVISLSASPREIKPVQRIPVHISLCSIAVANQNDVLSIFWLLLSLSKQVRSPFCSFSSQISLAFPWIVINTVWSNQALYSALTAQLYFKPLLETKISVQLLVFVFSGASKYRYNYNSWRCSCAEGILEEGQQRGRRPSPQNSRRSTAPTVSPWYWSSREWQARYRQIIVVWKQIHRILTTREII